MTKTAAKPKGKKNAQAEDAADEPYETGTGLKQPDKKKKPKEYKPVVNENGTVNRSIVMEIWVKDDDEKKTGKNRVIEAIQQYRAALRHCFGCVATVQAAGGSYNPETGRISPDNAKAKQVLATVFGQEGKLFGYELRLYVLRDLCPTWMSYVWDGLRRDIQTAWRAGDPEFTKASRGWLILQGARGFNQFNRRGIPILPHSITMSGHTLTLKWDKVIGDVMFQLDRLDGGRYHVWKNLRDSTPGWTLGTCFLSEERVKKIRRLKFVMTYACPANSTALDPTQTVKVTVRPEGKPGEMLFKISGPNGVTEYDEIDIAGVIGWLDQTRAEKTALEQRRAAYGNSKAPWGHRHGWLRTQDVITRLTNKREGGVKDHNHSWARRIATRAKSWLCGRIVMEGMPDTGITSQLDKAAKKAMDNGEEVPDVVAGLAGHPWNWSQFKAFLAYKFGEVGGREIVWGPDDVQILQPQPEAQQ